MTRQALLEQFEGAPVTVVLERVGSGAALMGAERLAKLCCVVAWLRADVVL